MTSRGWQTGAFSTRKPGAQSFVEQEGPHLPPSVEFRRAQLKLLLEIWDDGGKLAAHDLIRVGLYDREHCKRFHVRFDSKLCVTCGTTWCGGPPCGSE